MDGLWRQAAAAFGGVEVWQAARRRSAQSASVLHALLSAPPTPVSPCCACRLQEAAQEAAEEGERLQQQLAAGEISVEAFVER